MCSRWTLRRWTSKTLEARQTWLAGIRPSCVIKAGPAAGPPRTQQTTLMMLVGSHAVSPVAGVITVNCFCLCVL